MKRTRIASGGVVALVVALAGGTAHAADAWTQRMFDYGNTGNVGDDPKLTPQNVVDLERSGKIPATGQVNATPIVVEGLLFIGDRPTGRFYVADTATRQTLLVLETDSDVPNGIAPGHTGIEATAVYGEVTVPAIDGNGQPTTAEEKRIFIGVHRKPESFWCLNVSKILGDRPALLAREEPGDGLPYLCDGPPGALWPRYVGATGDPVDYSQHPLPAYDAAPIFRKDQPVLDPKTNEVEIHDLLFLPSLGDCSDGQLWAYDAWSGEIFWIFDPVPNVQDLTGTDALPENGPNARTFYPGIGGQIWTQPATNRSDDTVYVTTGNCFTFKQQVGFRAQAIIALDAETGAERWYHQRRVADTFDMDVGNSPTVIDAAACNVVVAPDKNGCVYGYAQQPDVPEASDPRFDPLRPGQQHVLWRTCLVPGSLTGGFRAQAAAAHDRYLFVQSSAITSVPGDAANAFVLDACDGTLKWSTGVVGKGSAEAAAASGMFFHANGQKLRVFEAGPARKLLAEASLSNLATPGGGGPAIVDGVIYVPVIDGVDVIEVAAGSGAATPGPDPEPAYQGPYPYPIATGLHDR